MPQDQETGAEAVEAGRARADEVGALIGATRIGPKSNEFIWRGRRVVIKTGSSAVVTEATLDRVEAVIFAEWRNGGWEVYEVDPRLFREASVPSRSRAHDSRYRQVGKAKIRDIGRARYPIDRGDRRSLKEMSRLGTEIIARLAKTTLRPEDDGNFIAVEVDGGEYEIDEDDFTAVTRLRDRLPSAEIWLGCIGQDTTYLMRRHR